jgi:hypothetical protein
LDAVGTKIIDLEWIGTQELDYLVGRAPSSKQAFHLQMSVASVILGTERSFQQQSNTFGLYESVTKQEEPTEQLLTPCNKVDAAVNL